MVDLMKIAGVGGRRRRRGRGEGWKFDRVVDVDDVMEKWQQSGGCPKLIDSIYVATNSFTASNCRCPRRLSSVSGLLSSVMADCFVQLRYCPAHTMAVPQQTVIIKSNTKNGPTSPGSWSYRPSLPCRRCRLPLPLRPPSHSWQKLVEMAPLIKIINPAIARRLNKYKKSTEDTKPEMTQ